MAQRTDTGEQVELHCLFLLMCSGYYDYEHGHTPEFPGSADFKGRLIHAQHWPEDLDYRGKKVVVIGSGATAVTLVPELARDAAQTIMLQRSPTYIASVPEEDPTAVHLQRFLPGSWVYRLTRWKRVLFQIYIFNLSRWRPKLVKKFLLDLAHHPNASSPGKAQGTITGDYFPDPFGPKNERVSPLQYLLQHGR